MSDTVHPGVRVTFHLPEQSEELQEYLRGPAALAALHQIRMEVFRPARKHGYPADSTIAEEMRRLEQLTGGVTDGAELVRLLEQRYSELLDELQLLDWS